MAHPITRRQFFNLKDKPVCHTRPTNHSEVAAGQDAPLIDMHRKSESVLKRYGAEESRTLFLQLAPGEHPNYPDGIEDNTHFSPDGAKIMAGLAAEGIRECSLGLVDVILDAG